MYLNIQEGAIFIADSHFNEKNREFLRFLRKLESKDIITSQLFLLGDIFDFLSVESIYFVEKNKEIIELLNKLSKVIEIVYLEGNHDYNLAGLFPNINIIPRKKQPFLAKLKNNQTVSLSHGDNFINWQYDLFCKIIRSSLFLKFMNSIDKNYFISKKIEKSLMDKSICRKIVSFEHLVKDRINNYDTDIVIEGHYHQGKIFSMKNKRYINVPSLCCQKRYVRFDELEFKGESL